MRFHVILFALFYSSIDSVSTSNSRLHQRLLIPQADTQRHEHGDTHLIQQQQYHGTIIEHDPDTLLQLSSSSTVGAPYTPAEVDALWDALTPTYNQPCVYRYYCGADLAARKLVYAGKAMDCRARAMQHNSIFKDWSDNQSAYQGARQMHPFKTVPIEPVGARGTHETCILSQCHGLQITMVWEPLKQYYAKVKKSKECGGDDEDEKSDDGDVKMDDKVDVGSDGKLTKAPVVSVQTRASSAGGRLQLQNDAIVSASFVGQKVLTKAQAKNQISELESYWIGEIQKLPQHCNRQSNRYSKVRDHAGKEQPPQQPLAVYLEADRIPVKAVFAVQAPVATRA